MAGPLMWSEISEQPDSLLRVVESGCEFLSRKVRKPPFASLFLSKVEQVVLFGSGSSYHAACLARDYLAQIARLPARAVYASDAFLQPEFRPARTLALAFSHSGLSSDVLGAVKRARRQGVPTGAVTNVAGSALTRAVDDCWVTGAGVENAIPSTKGFTAAAAAALMLAYHVGSSRKISKSTERAAVLISRAARILDEWLASSHRIQRASAHLARARSVALLGKGLLYPVACDGALKLLEVTYVPALAYPPEEFRHGPIAVADEGLVLVALLPRRRDQTLLRIMEEVSQVGATIITVGPNPSAADHTFVEIPRVDPLLAPIVYMPALQLLAHGTGAILGRPIDQPRRLKKVVGAT
jgi:glucosamine--fructose-6-phosphate aminotransferase (isomerizing)